MRFSPRIFLKPLFKADDLCVIYAEHRLFLLPRKGVFMDFLTSLAVICLSALLLGSICSKIKLPPLFVALENAIEEWVPYSGLLSVISFGAVMFAKHEVCAKRLSGKFSRLWVFAEILLFVLVGAEVNIGYALNNCGIIICVIILALVFRMAGVFMCVAFSKLNMKERLFCMIAYSPKATVQAAIGAVPLAMG